MRSSEMRVEMQAGDDEEGELPSSCSFTHPKLPIFEARNSPTDKLK